ncbi:MAG TPA: FKBP-type peptidyl-prolyl cis-trans isomerase [Thermoleophilaceae bacterium]|nr:FKBP-type peptidyl-prolyl cis-trans isomerase [Thermoleophilaceae bacterium]
MRLRPTSVRAAALVSALALALAASGCGGDDDESAATTPQETAPAETAPPAEDPAPAESGDEGSKPEVEVPKGDPPAKLEITDIEKGDGATAKSGDNVTVHYVGVSFSSGEQFDASWDRGQPFPFTLGQGDVIPGWDEGVAGMKVGGRRMLVIPPDLAYGEAGSPPVIGPNETLVFVVDLLAVE